MIDFKYLKREATKKLFNDLDNLISDYHYAFKAIDNLEKSNLHKQEEDW